MSSWWDQWGVKRITRGSGAYMVIYCSTFCVFRLYQTLSCSRTGFLRTLHTCTHFKSPEEGPRCSGESKLVCPASDSHVQLAPPEEHCTAVSMQRNDVPSQGTPLGRRGQAGGSGAGDQAGTPTVPAGMEPQGLSWDFSASTVGASHATWREEDTGTEGAREEPTDLSSIPDCSMASNPKMSAQRLTFQTYKSARNSLIDCLQGAVNPRPLSNGMVCGHGMESTSGTSSPARPLPWRRGHLGDTRLPLPVPHTVSHHHLAATQSQLVPTPTLPGGWGAWRGTRCEEHPQDPLVSHRQLGLRGSITFGPVHLPQATRFLTGKKVIFFLELETFSCENGSFDKGLSFCDGDNQNETSHLESKWKGMENWNSYTFCFDISHSKLLRILSLLCENVPFLIFFFYLFHWGKRIWKCWHFLHEIFQALSREAVPTSTLSKARFLAPHPTNSLKDLWKTSNLNKTLPILKAKLMG